MKNLKSPIRNFIVCLSLIQFALVATARPLYMNTVEGAEKQVQINKIAIKKAMGKASDEQIEKVAAYLVSIGLTPDKPNFKFQLDRILKSSLQFIFCENIEDWSCLEKKPEFTPKSKMRIDISSTLGKPVSAGESLEMEYYFTKAWHQNYGRSSSQFVIPEVTVANILASKIKSEGEKSIWMALYGIDDIENTMSSVYKAIEEKVNAGVNTLAVLDVVDVPKPNKEIRDYDLSRMSDGTYMLSPTKLALDYSYTTNNNSYNSAYTAPAWSEEFLSDIARLAKTMKRDQLKNHIWNNLIVKPNDTQDFEKPLSDLTWIAFNRSLDDYKENLARITFQYGNTLQLLRLLNKNVKLNTQSVARLEFPFKEIMHNKYFVFEKNDGSRSVWTGTTNVTKECMGQESNSNMAILIKNTTIANEFIKEFEEMFSGFSKAPTKPSTLLTGAYHDKKTANTRRYFTFTDKTEVRLHFSPTDDGEHRALIPLIQSARAGDILRISMFGAGGFELVRAMQAAAARGVDIRIVVDRVTGSGQQSWWQDKFANVLEVNPYSENPTGSINIRKNKWNGLNHHKSATLTRKLSDGSYRAEVIVIGSQNWSQGGNDKNDENMVTIRNKSKSLPVMDAFNAEFDQNMWPLTIDVREDTGSAGDEVEEE
jgi:hypothetical protein